MSGAAILAGSGALRAGAGLVQVAVPAEILAIVATGNPCYTTAGMPQDMRGRFAHAALDELVELAHAATVVAVGPGLSQSETLPQLIEGLLTRINKPMVLDADALNAVSQLRTPILSKRTAPTVLTPHPGEFARLVNTLTGTVQTNRQTLAIEYAKNHRAILVLKGHKTLVTDGHLVHENATGNPGMATGGTGDVLTGVVAGLLAQGLNPYDAAVLGVWVHGRAGDLAADRVGECSLIASDLLVDLPSAFRERTN